APNMIPCLGADCDAGAMRVSKPPEGLVPHATIRIGNAPLEIDEAHGEYQPKPCLLHVYVPDADAMYAQALLAGATSVDPPTDKPYRDRSAAVKDPFGNTWYFNTYIGR